MRFAVFAREPKESVIYRWFMGGCLKFFNGTYK
jgi:hypothetical protein